MQRQITNGNEIMQMARDLLIRTNKSDRLAHIAKCELEMVNQYIDAFTLMKEDVKDIRTTALSKLETLGKTYEDRGYFYKGYTFRFKKAYNVDDPKKTDFDFLEFCTRNTDVTGLMIYPHLPSSSEISAVLLELQQQKRILENKEKVENKPEAKTAGFFK